jgi:CRP/FNR family transcriptional regulator
VKCEADSFDIKQLISQIPKMRNLRGAVWERALASAALVQESHGNPVCARQDAEHFGIVLRGALVLRVHSQDGRVFNTHKVPVGEMCMMSVAAALGSPVNVADVIAEGDLLLLRLPASHLDELLAQSPEFRKFTLTSMTSCFGRMLGMVEEVAFERLHTRIESTLRNMARARGEPTIAMTHQDLANELGSSREVISRLLKQMERDGTLKLGRGVITLLPGFRR